MWVQLICLAAGLCRGELGFADAYWREKTFQTLAYSVLGLLLYVGILEAAIAFAGADSPAGVWAARFEPYRALFSVLDPLARHASLGPAPITGWESVVACSPSPQPSTRCRAAAARREPVAAALFGRALMDEDAVGEVRVRHRTIWSNPVIWREMCTRALWTPHVLRQAAYLALAGFAAFSLWNDKGRGELVLG